MQKYELMVIFDPSTEDKQVTPILEKSLAVITNAGGTVDNLDMWGRRKLAYQINKNNEGIYAVVNVHSNPDEVNEVERQLRLNEQIMRTKIMRYEDAVFSINPVEFEPEKPQKKAPRKAKAS
jgi:small subunit ribosomal protein S6